MYGCYPWANRLIVKQEPQTGFVAAQGLFAAGDLALQQGQAFIQF